MPDSAAALRELVRSRAAGRCEYCGIEERSSLIEHEVDHVIALKHGGQTVAENLALCCRLCNRYKGSEISSVDPQTGRLTALFNPRFDTWADHFAHRDGEIIPLTGNGRVTVQLLRLNRPMRIQERRASRA